MKTNSRLSVLLLQQKSSRPGAPIVLTVFTLVYFLYLLTILIINMQAGWFVRQVAENGIIEYSEVYTFDYYFNSNNYISREYDKPVPASTTPYLIRSEIIFLASLASIVLVLTAAHVRMRSGNDTMKRLSISHRSVIAMQWLSDFIYTLSLWFSHLAVIFLLHMVYVRLAPWDLVHQSNLYTLFAAERYLYMLFPVVNPLSLIRMFSLILAISFLPSLISGIIDSILEKDFFPGIFVLPTILTGLICWSYFSSSHTGSLILCVIAALVGAFCFYVPLLGGGVTNAKQ